MAATLSAVLPGLGQLVNGRHRLAKRLFFPFLAVGVLGWLVVQVLSGPRLLATLVDPAVLSGLLVLNVLVLAWRVGAVGQAFFDRQFTLAPGRKGLLGLALLVAVVALPHGLVTIHGLNARDTFGGVFAATSDPDDDPGSR
ncbi:MAG TPA: hypothetical protein VM344_06045, partial [Vitreimonas sp.]|nr:hypothetical protein [Vitreimonas sp.]